MITDQAIFPLVKLSDLVEIQIGKTPSRDNPSFWGEGYTWVSISDLNGNKYIANSKEQITQLGVQNSNIKLTKAGNLLFSYKLSIGKVAFAGKDLYTNEAIASFIIKKGVPLLSAYFYYVMREFDFTATSDKAAKGQTLNKAKLKDLKIPLPPLEIQKKIAAIMDAADEYRQKTKALIEKYDELAQSLFLEMFGDPVKNEKGWEKIELQHLGNISSGSTPSRKRKENFIGDIPWVKTGEIKGAVINKTEEKISKEALKKSSCRLYPKGSIIIAMYGQGKTRGKVGLLGIEATTNQACAVIQPSDKMNFVFLLQLLKLSYDELRDMGRGGNQPNLNVGLVKNFEVINPKIDLQVQFAHRIQNIEAQNELAQEALEKSEDLFNSLLQKAFKGELV